MVTSRHNQRQTKEHGKILTADKKLRDKTATSIVVFYHSWLTKLCGETFESIFVEKCSKIYGTAIYLLSRSKAQWNIELLSAALPWNSYESIQIRLKSLFQLSLILEIFRTQQPFYYQGSRICRKTFPFPLFIFFLFRGSFYFVKIVLWAQVSHEWNAKLMTFFFG